MNKNKLKELNALAKKYGYRFSQSANTAIGCTNMYDKEGKILIGNGSYQKCIDLIKKRELITTKFFCFEENERKDRQDKRCEIQCSYCGKA